MFTASQNSAFNWKEMVIYLLEILLNKLPWNVKEYPITNCSINDEYESNNSLYGNQVWEWLTCFIGHPKTCFLANSSVFDNILVNFGTKQNILQMECKLEVSDSSDFHKLSWTKLSMEAFLISSKKNRKCLQWSKILGLFVCSYEDNDSWFIC